MAVLQYYFPLIILGHLRDQNFTLRQETFSNLIVWQIIQIPPVSKILKQLEGKEYSLIYSCFLMKSKNEIYVCTDVRSKQFQTVQKR